MKNKEPEKINIENNTIGINFSESKKIKSYFDKNKNVWSKEIVSGPVVNKVATIYINSKRLKDIIELEEQKILIDIEKKTKIKLKSLRVEIENNQQ